MRVCFYIAKPLLISVRIINQTRGRANFLYVGPHLKKMLLPRAAHSLQCRKMFQCVNNHLFILQK